MSAEEEEPKKHRPSLRVPLLGLLGSLIVFVLSILLGFNTLCGPGTGYNRGGPTPAATMIFLVPFFGSLLGFLVFGIWLVVAAVLRELNE